MKLATKEKDFDFSSLPDQGDQGVDFSSLPDQAEKQIDFSSLPDKETQPQADQTPSLASRAIDALKFITAVKPSPIPDQQPDYVGNKPYDVNAQPVDKFLNEKLIKAPEEAAPVVRQFIADKLAGSLSGQPDVPATRENILQKAQQTGQVPYADIINRVLTESIPDMIPLTPAEIATYAALGKATDVGLAKLAEVPIFRKSLSQIPKAIQEWVMTKPQTIDVTPQALRDFFVFGKEKLDPQTYDFLTSLPKENIVEMIKARQGTSFETRVPRFGGAPEAPVTTLNPGVPQESGNLPAVPGIQAEPAPILSPKGSDFLRNNHPVIAKVVDSLPHTIDPEVLKKTIVDATTQANIATINGASPEEAQAAALQHFGSKIDSGELAPKIEPQKPVKVDAQGIPVRKPTDVVTKVDLGEGQQVPITHAQVLNEAKALQQDALSSREVSPLESFVKKYGGVKGYKGGMEGEEFKGVPVHLRGRVSVDEMAQMAFHRGILDEPSGDLLREKLKEITPRGREPRLGDFYDQAVRNLEYYAQEGVSIPENVPIGTSHKQVESGNEIQDTQLQMWQSSPEISRILQSLPQSTHADLAKIASIKPGTAAAHELPRLYSHLRQAGQDSEGALSDLREYFKSGSPSRLQQAIGSDVALPSVSHGPPQGHFIGYQTGLPGDEPFPLFNIPEGYPNAGSTVDLQTLKDQGIPVPKIPSMKDWEESRMPSAERAKKAANEVLKTNKIDDKVFVRLVDHIAVDDQAFARGYGKPYRPNEYEVQGATYTPGMRDRIKSVIELAESADTGVGRHEAFHAVSNLLLDEAEQKIITDRFGDMEKAADAFAEYRKTGQAETPLLERIFNKIRDFLDRIKNWVESKKFKTADDLFKDIEEGKLKGKGTEEKAAQYSAQPSDLESKALKEYGETNNLRNAGFVFPNGKMVDFAQGGDVRLHSHHDAIDSLLGRPNSLYDFMDSTNALRVVHYSDLGGEHISFQAKGPLTSDQLNQIRDYMAENKVAHSNLEKINEIGRTVGRTANLDNPTIEDVSRFFNGTSQYKAVPQKDVVTSLKDSTREIRDLVNPTKAAPLAAAITREQLGKMARSFDKAEAALGKAHSFFEGQSVANNIDFIDKMEHGQIQSTPELQQIATQLRELLDSKRGEVQALGTGKLKNFIENYFPHVWDQSEGKVSKAVQVNAKRPFEGRKSFLKNRKLEYFKDGIDLGLTPASYNPIDQAFLKIREMDKYIAAHKTLQEFKDEGLTQFVKIGNKPPEGWTRINDNISQVMRPITDEQGKMQGLAIVGHYYSQPDAARIINNYLSPGLQKSEVYRAYRYLGNAINQFQLGLSAFHLGFTSVDSMVSKFALALNKLALGHPISAISSALQTPIAPISNILRGDKLLKAWKGTGNTTDEILAQAMASGGGRAKMDTFYATKAYDQMKKFFKSGKYVKGILQAPFAAMEASSKPILEYIVPRQKLGVFSDIMKMELEHKPNMSHEELRSIAQKAWDSVDNRMGQLVYDNLFWNRTFKDLLMASVRSVGWNLGTIREVGGGIKDIGKIGRGPKGRGANLSYRTSYLAALPIVAGLGGAIYQYLRTGKGPQELKDYYFPRTGALDANGDPTRVSLPSYMKDLYHYSQHPVTTVTNKLSPLIGMVAQMLNNKDFFGVRIRNEDDPLIKQVLQETAYIGKQLVPFGIRNAQKNMQSDKEIRDIVEPFIGITPAPYDINQTKAETLAHRIAARHIPIGGRTQEQADHSRMLNDFSKRLRLNDPNVRLDMMTAIRDRKATPVQIANINRSAHLTNLQRLVHSFSAEEIQKVYDAATPDEKKEIEGMLKAKKARARQLVEP